jgi:S1-C subfamily serine protease
MLQRTRIKTDWRLYIKAVTLIPVLKKQDWKRDVIIKLDNQNIATYADLSGYINTKRPNDKVDVTILRDGSNKTLPVVLSKKSFIAQNLKELN